VNCWLLGGIGDVVVLCGMIMCCWLLRQDVCGRSEFFSIRKACSVVGSGYLMVGCYERQWVGVVAGLVLRRTGRDWCGMQSDIRGY